MSALSNPSYNPSGKFALLYCAVGGKQQVFQDLTDVEVVAKIGEVLWAAHRKGLKLEYVRTVSFNKRPGRKPIIDASRDTCTEEELRTFCKRTTQAWLASRR